MARGPYGRAQVGAARAYLDTLIESGAIRPAKRPILWTDDYALRIANSLARQQAAGEAPTLAVARRGRRLVRTGPEAGTYVAAPERRKPRDIGTWGQGIEFASAAALVAYARRNLTPGEPGQVTAYGKPAATYQVPEYLRTQLATGATGRTWRTILTSPDLLAEPAMADGRALIREATAVGIESVRAWELRWQL